MENQPGKLLIVEDIPDILALIKTTLEFKGYKIVTARNGQEALDAIEQERPAIIITDILMPKMDGFSLVHQLRIDPATRDIPVIFLSATYVTPEDKAFALSLGVTRFIEKPVNFEEFLPAVSDLLSQGEKSEQKPLDEFEFYDGYRKRLETKLLHKNSQIARARHLMDTIPDAEKSSVNTSLQQAYDEQREIQKLLDQIHELLENYDHKDQQA
ncbi:MAG TPA: response regulator [Anaerolineales bacterium]|nr:response regulator [Anaerolineales bacterium]